MSTPYGLLNQKTTVREELIAHLSKYNLPAFMLERIARQCNSELIKKGKITSILGSMNDASLELLHKIFVQCEDDPAGEFSDCRFCVYISSRIHSTLAFNHHITGKSKTVHMVKVAVFGEQGLVAVGENKTNGERVSSDELLHFSAMVKDICQSKDAQTLLYAFYGSSVGYEEGAISAFADNVKHSNPTNKRDKSVPATTMVLLEFKQRNMNQVSSTVLR